MKIVRKSNFDHEDYRGDQYFVAQKLTAFQAKRVADLLNKLEARDSDDFYCEVEDNYVLPPEWKP